MDLFKWPIKLKSDKRMFLSGLLLLLAIFAGFDSDQNCMIYKIFTNFQSSCLQLPTQPIPESVNFRKSISTTINDQSFNFFLNLSQGYMDLLLNLIETTNFLSDSKLNGNFTNLWTDVINSLYNMKYQGIQHRTSVCLSVPKISTLHHIALQTSSHLM